MIVEFHVKLFPFFFGISENSIEIHMLLHLKITADRDIRSKDFFFVTLFQETNNHTEYKQRNRGKTANTTFSNSFPPSIHLKCNE